jgi:hypothetical protein
VGTLGAYPPSHFVDDRCGPGVEERGDVPMRRLHTLLTLVVLLCVLVMPAVARANDPPAPDGWTWDEAVPAVVAPDGWTWDEAVAPAVAPA